MDAGASYLMPLSRLVRSQRRRYCVTMLSACCAFLVLHALGNATAFMLPAGTSKSYSGGSKSIYGRRLGTMRLLGLDASISRSKGGLLSRMRTTTLASSAVKGDTSTTSSSSSSNSGNGKSAPEPVVYAQEALDRAWRSKRRIAAQGKSKPLKQRFMNAFGGRSAVFVDDRDFMEETLDNVVRVRRLGGCREERGRKDVKKLQIADPDGGSCRCSQLWKFGFFCTPWTQSGH